jgi:hypothetical protein
MRLQSRVKGESDIVLGGPFTLEVTNSHVDISSTIVYGNGLASALAGQTTILKSKSL